jgi:stage III sporulation protein AB
MRIIGACLLMAAFFLAGVGIVHEKRTRIRTLRELCAALEIMQGELSVRESPLPELCQMLSIHGSGKAKILFTALLEMLPLLGECSFSVLWDKAILCCKNDLNASEREAVRSLGLVLGRYDTLTQIRQLQSCARLLNQNMAADEQRFPADRKLLLGLGASAGVMMAVLLW